MLHFKGNPSSEPATLARFCLTKNSKSSLKTMLPKLFIKDAWERYASRSISCYVDKSSSSTQQQNTCPFSYHKKCLNFSLKYERKIIRQWASVILRANIILTNLISTLAMMNYRRMIQTISTFYSQGLKSKYQSNNKAKIMYLTKSNLL